MPFPQPVTRESRHLVELIAGVAVAFLITVVAIYGLRQQEP